MLILLGAILIGMFGIAGTFLSIEAKQRKDEDAAKSSRSRRPSIGQVISEER